MATLKITVLVMLALHTAQSYGAKYNESSGCVYYCVYLKELYCCDDGSLKSESSKYRLDSPDLPRDDLRPAKVKKKAYTQVKKNIYKSVQALKKSRSLETEDFQGSQSKRMKRAVKKNAYAQVKKILYKSLEALKKSKGLETEIVQDSRPKRTKRDATEVAFPPMEASERSSRSRKASKNSAKRRNYQGIDSLSSFKNPLLSSLPFSLAEHTNPNFEVEKIAVNMSSLPIFPAQGSPFSRGPIRPSFLSPHGGPSGFAHSTQNNELIRPNPFAYGTLNNLINPFGFVNGKESGDGLDIGVIPASTNYSRTFTGYPGSSLFNEPFPAPFAPGSLSPDPFGNGPFDSALFTPAPFNPAPFGPGSFGSMPEYSHMPSHTFSPMHSHLPGLHNNETIEKSFSTHSIHTPTYSLFSPFSFSGNLASPHSNIIVDNSITKAISPHLQLPESNLRFRRHPEIPLQSFSIFNSLSSPRTILPSITSGLSPFGSSVSSFGSSLPSFSSGFSSFSPSSGLRFSSSTGSSGLSFQNGLAQPIHEIHPLLKSSFGSILPSTSNKHNFGSLSPIPSTPFSFNNARPINLHNTQNSAHTSTFGNSHFKTSGFSSQLKDDTVLPHPPPTSPSTGGIGHPSPVRHSSADGALSSHTKLITHHGHPSHSDGPASRQVRDHSSHGHQNHVHHDHHDPIQQNHQKGLHHSHSTPLHQGQPNHLRQDHPSGHSFSYIDDKGDHHIHFRGAPSLPHPPQPSRPLPQPPSFPSSSLITHLPPHPPPLSTHILPPSAVLPLEKHHSTPELPSHPPLSLFPPSPLRLNREVVPVPVLPLENSASSKDTGEKSSTEIVLNIGEVRSSYKGIQEITLNIGESLIAGSDVEVDEQNKGRKTLTVNFPSKKSVDETQDTSASTAAFPKTSSHTRPLSFPEDIPFFENDSFNPILIGDQIIKETDGPKFVRDTGFSPFRSGSTSSSFGSDFAFSSSGRTSSQPPFYNPNSQVAPRPQIAALKGSTLEAFKKFTNQNNLDFAFNDLLGEAPSFVESPTTAFESLSPEVANPFHLIEHAKPRSVAEQIVLLEKICPCLARPTAFQDREHCRCPAADRVAVAYRRTKREPYVVMTYKHFLIDRLALELEANLKTQTRPTTPRTRRPSKSKVPPTTDWTPMLGPGSGAFHPRDNRHIEDLFLISIPEKDSDGRKIRDGTAQTGLDSKGLSAIKNAIEEFVKTVEGHNLDRV